MPHFDAFYADKLRGGLGRADADAVLDLRSAGIEQGIRSLEAMIERSRFGETRSVAILIDPPPEGGGETLFQPIGRLLLDAKKRGWVLRLNPLPARDGLGFYAELAGKPEREA